MRKCEKCGASMKLDLRLKCKECGKSHIGTSFRTGKPEFVSK